MLQLEGLTMRFGGLVAVDALSIEITKNSISSVIGPNGAGKTTVFNLIGGVHKPVSGKIIFEEKEIQGLKPFQINKQGISRTYQNINLFGNMTAAENIMVGNHSKISYGLTGAILHTRKQKSEEKRTEEKVNELMKFIGLADKKNVQAKHLSYGEQRLVEIARAIVVNPGIVLLDEPAAGMNTKEKNDLIELIYKIREMGITVLLVEHDMNVVMGISDFVLVMNYGKEIARGKPYEVQNNSEVITAYLGEE